MLQNERTTLQNKDLLLKDLKDYTNQKGNMSNNMNSNNNNFSLDQGAQQNLSGIKRSNIR